MRASHTAASAGIRGWAWVLWLAALCLALPAANAQEDDDAPETYQAEILDPRIARELLPAYEKLQEGAFQPGLADLDALMQRFGDAMKPFDLATVLQIRGSAHVNLDRYEAAVRDFERALQLAALPPDQNTQLRFNLAQLHFQVENWAESIRHLRQWLRETPEQNHSAWFMLAAAYYYQDDHANARQPVERAIGLAPEPDRRYYDLANIVYAELDLAGPRTRLLERIVTHWPDAAGYWKQLAGLHLEQGRERDSFSVLELAYKSGLVDEEGDIVALAQFYSTFDNPHRGAALLEEEIEAGRVERSVSHLELLSQLWSQAREHRKAIPVLEEAARVSDTGMLSYRLGQVLLADEQNERAERALTAALDKGGLTDEARADAWVLLGTARFAQAGPGDRDRRLAADQAFAAAERFASTRRHAAEWRDYIRAINDTEDRQAALEAEQAEALAEAARRREYQACRTEQIAGRTLSQVCRALLEDDSSSLAKESEQHEG